MISKYIAVFFLTGLSCATLKAQQKDSPSSLSGKSVIINNLHPWLRTDNAAAVSTISSDIGSTSIGANFEQGDFRRPQQAKHSEKIVFHSERYQKLAKAFLYGSFRFTQQWDADIKWSQMLDPYRGTPYILADSLGGDWTKQFYELNLKAATAKLANERLTLGLGLNFKAGTGARQNDPRPVNTSNELGLTPSLIWHLSPHHQIGLNGAYSIYKEEIITDVKDYTTNQKRYMLTGLSTYLPVDNFGLPSIRNYKGDTYGGDLQYEWNNRKWSWLTSIGYRRRSEELVDGESTPRKWGSLEEKEYKVLTSINYNDQKFHHSLTAKWNQYDRDGLEEHQFFNKDSAVLKYETLLKAVLSGSLVTNAEFIYQLVRLSDAEDFSWLLQAGVLFRGLDNRYYYPTGSLQIADMVDYTLGARKNWAFKNNNLQAGINFTYTSRVTSREENNGLSGGGSIVATQYFFPDHGYLSSGAWKADASVQYAFSVNKVKNAQFFIRANGNLREQTGKEYFGVNGNRTQFAITIGAFY